MGVRAKLSAASDIVGVYGGRTFLFQAVPWLLRRKYFVYACRTPDIGRGASPAPEDAFRLDIVRESDIDLVTRLRPAAYSRRVVADRLAQGHLCFLGRLGPEAVHIRWLYTRPVYLPYLGRTLDLRPGEVYSDEAYILSAYRGRNLYSRTLSLLGSRLTDLGIRRLIVLSASWNRIIIARLEETGLKRVGECGVVRRVWGRRFYALGAAREQGRRAFSVDEE